MLTWFKKLFTGFAGKYLLTCEYKRAFKVSINLEAPVIIYGWRIANSKDYQLEYKPATYTKVVAIAVLWNEKWIYRSDDALNFPINMGPGDILALTMTWKEDFDE